MGWLRNLLAAGPNEKPVAASPVMVDVDFVAVDVETSCSRNSSICQVGIVGFKNGLEVLTYETLVDPRDTFDPFNVSLHGIDRHHVRGKPSFSALHQTLSLHLGRRITVAHSSFDKGAFAAAATAYGVPEIQARWLDSVMVARRAWPQLANHKLNTLADHLGISFRHHDALNDARTAGLVVLRAGEQTGLSLEDWFKRPARRQYDAAPVARDGGEGPLKGQCICMSGDMTIPKAALADQIAAAGGQVTSSVSRKTTILVLGAQDLSSFAGKSKSAKHLKAEEMILAGYSVEIIDEAALRARMS